MTNPAFLVSTVIGLLVMVSMIFIYYKPMLQLERTYEELAADGFYLEGMYPTGTAETPTPAPPGHQVSSNSDGDPSVLIVHLLPFHHDAVCASPASVCELESSALKANLTDYLAWLIPEQCSYDVRFDIIVVSLITGGVFTIAFFVCSIFFVCGEKNVVHPMCPGILNLFAFLAMSTVLVVGFLSWSEYRCFPDGSSVFAGRKRSLSGDGFSLGEGAYWGIGSLVGLLLNMILVCLAGSMVRRGISHRKGEYYIPDGEEEGHYFDM